MKYPSKKDGWVAFLLLPILVLMPAGAVVLLYVAVSLPNGLPALVPALILLAVSGFTFWSFFSTSCEITSSDLIVRFGPLRWTIPLEGITQVLPKNGLSPDWAWGVAWSLDRVVIHYRKRNGRRAFLGVAVSPADKEGFLRDLAEAVRGLESSGAADFRP